MDDIGLYHDSWRADELSIRFREVRAATEALAADLTEEDQCVQSMPDASPAKWHRAHITWFFEQFVLVPHVPGYRAFDPAFSFLFNSYYEAVGPRHPRPSRGLLTRPPAHRLRFTAGMWTTALVDAIPRLPPEIARDHRTRAASRTAAPGVVGHRHAACLRRPSAVSAHESWIGGSRPGIQARRLLSSAPPVCGRRIDAIGFCFDNETPRHKVYLAPYAIASRLVRNREWLEFIAGRGYQTPRCGCPMDGRRRRKPDGRHRCIGVTSTAHWFQVGPGGLAPLIPDAPVRHISWYEADAFARWSNARLPTEFEWEAASSHPVLSRNDRPCLAVDRKCLPALSGLSRSAGGDRRVQRKIHDQPDGTAWRIPGDAGRHTRARPTGTSSTPTSDGSLAAFVWQKTYNAEADVPNDTEFVPLQTRADVPAIALAGLTATPKTLPAMLFYDDEGCRLFYEITRLPEYYLTRTETALLRSIAAAVVPNEFKRCCLIEFGGSDETKARISARPSRKSIQHLCVDRCCGAALARHAMTFGADHPDLTVVPVVADFMQPLLLPPLGSPRMGFFPGSTIGNLDPAAATAFLASARVSLGADHGSCSVRTCGKARKCCSRPTMMPRG